MRKAQINIHGLILLDRAGVMQKQFCPYQNFDSTTSECGDWCPQFDEPEPLTGGKYILGLCHGKHICADNFQDFRVRGAV